MEEVETKGPSSKMYFFEEFVIEEVTGVNFDEAAPGAVEVRMSKEPCIFVDRKEKLYYQFSDLSDTARILYQFTDADTIKAGVPYDFEKVGFKPGADLLVPLPDTLINYVAFKRFKTRKVYTLNMDTMRTTEILYLRCDDKEYPIQWNKEIGDQYGCAFVRVDYENYGYGTLIEKVSDRLTPGEIAIFKSWIKKVRKYPGNPPGRRPGLNWPITAPEQIMTK